MLHIPSGRSFKISTCAASGRRAKLLLLMKKSPKSLADVRQALSGRQLSPSQADSVTGGGRYAFEFPRLILAGDIHGSKS